MIPSQQLGIEQFLFFNGVPDLDSVRELIGVGVGQLRRREGCSMDAVASGASAGHDDPIAGPRLLVDSITRNQPDAPAENQRIAQVTFIKVDRPVDRGNAHPIAVVTDAADHSLEHSPGVEHVFGQPGRVEIGRGEAENVGGGDRFSSQAATHDITDTTADAGGRSPIGLNGRGMVVGLDLEGNAVFVVEGDHPGVIDED